MRISSVTLLFALASCAFSAQSQPPTPGNRSPEGQPQAQEAAPAQTQPAPIQSGTEANPFVIRELRSEAQAAENRQDREEERANRRQSLWLSVVTVVVLGFQIWLLVQQNRIIRKQNVIMEGQRVAANTQSGYMRDSLVETRKAADATTASVEVARQTLVLNSRAFLYVRNVQMVPDENGVPVVVITFRNAGRLPATIIEQAVSLLTDEPLPATRGELIWVPVGGVAGPGQTVGVTTDMEVPFSPADWMRIHSGALTVAVYGAISYETGIEGYKGETGFGFTYEPLREGKLIHQRFAATYFDGYNYAR